MISYFQYKSTKFDKKNLILDLFFELNHNNEIHFFHEKIQFNINEKLLVDNFDTQEFVRLIKLIHLIEGISYYKTYLPKEIKHPYEMTPFEAEFFNKLFENGLGEFCYKNNVKFSQIASFIPQKPSNSTTNFEKPIIDQSKNMVLFGGGKDSIVTLEIIKNNSSITPILFVLNPKKIFENVISNLDLQIVTSTRTIEPLLFALNSRSEVKNGHVPITFMIAAIANLAMHMIGSSKVLLSNEYSASFGNLEYDGREINHQWDKSYEAENMFNNYIQSIINPSYQTISILRPLHEIAIVKIFSKFEKYFDKFASCNRNFQLGINTGQIKWCGSCPKCAFIYLLLANFISKTKIIQIFGKNLFEEERLLSTYIDLWGFGEAKPWECVGTFEESIYASTLLASNIEFKDDFIISYFAKHYLKEFGSDIPEARKRLFDLSPFHLLNKDTIDNISTLLQ